MWGKKGPIDTGTLILDRYRVENRLASGATSDVFVGHDPVLDRPVAIKVLRGDTPDRRRFASEIQLLATLVHPNLVRLYDAVDEPDSAVLVMELIDGPPLSHTLLDGPLPEPEVRRIGADLAGCLDYLHRNGVVHRDIKPANILLGSDGRPRLADFGIARLVDQTRLTRTGTAIGTLSYMAPEQISADASGPPADVYALGLVLLESLTGQRAFAGTGNEAVAARLVRDPELPPDLPPQWASMITQMTTRDPESRPSAAQVRDWLTGASAAETSVVATGAADPGATAVLAAPTVAIDRTEVIEGAPAPDMPSFPPPLPPKARRGAIYGLVAAAALILLVGLIALASRGGGDKPAATTTTTSTTAAPTTTSTTAAPTTAPPVTAVSCATIAAQQAAIDAQIKALDANKALSKKERDAAHKTLDAQKRALADAKKGCV